LIEGSFHASAPSYLSHVSRRDILIASDCAVATEKVEALIKRQSPEFSDVSASGHTRSPEVFAAT